MTRTIGIITLALAALLAVSPRPAAAQGAIGPLRRLLESGRVPPERQGTILEIICTRGEADDLALPFKLLIERGALSAETRRKVAELLAEAAVTREVKPSGDLALLAGLIDGEQAAADKRLQIAAVRLAAAWKLAELAPALDKLATSHESPPALARAALDGLVAIGGDKSRRTIEQLAASGQTRELRIFAAAALARLDVAAGARAAAGVLAAAKATDDLGPLLDALLSRKEGADQLATALAATLLSPDAAKLALRHVYALGRSDQRLSDVLSKAAGIALDAPPPSPEEATKIALRVAEHGDPARGEAMFRRADLSCMKCHAVAGAGGSVGPELTALGSISPVDYIVNSILNPNLAIKEQFVTRRVLTTDGELITGIQIDRDEQRLRLRDATGKVVVVPASSIDQESEGSSLMPQGLTKFLTEQEFFDLARFVSELGKPGPYAIRRTPTIQRWRVLKEPAEVLTTEVPNVEIFRQHVLDAADDQWTTAYGMVSGALPLSELPPPAAAVVIVQGEVDVSQAGPLAIEIASAVPTQLWIDAEPFEFAERLVQSLAAGKHKLTFRVERRASPAAQLRVELTKPAGSAIQFAVVNGQ